MELPLKEPPHPCVDWSRTRWQNGERCVIVRCGECKQERYDSAKSVAFRVRRERFTGRCWDCWQASHRRREEALPEHPAVDWSQQRTKGGETLVRVTCPVCLSPRWLAMKSVLRQVRSGEFRGNCLADRFLGRAKSGERPPWPGVFWDQVRIERDGPVRRRAMVRVECPECGRERWCQPSHTAAAIRKGTFRSECLTHRTPARVSLDRRERIWASIWLFAGDLGRGPHAGGAPAEA